MEPNASPARRAGPLADLRVVEFAGIGPGPFACMLLSDMGADVVTIDRPGARASDPRNVTQRGRTVVQADLKDAACIEQVLQLLQAADVLVEGFRPGVMERLGLGPEAVARRNARRVPLISRCSTSRDRRWRRRSRATIPPATHGPSA